MAAGGRLRRLRARHMPPGRRPDRGAWGRDPHTALVDLASGRLRRRRARRSPGRRSGVPATRRPAEPTPRMSSGWPGRPRATLQRMHLHARLRRPRRPRHAAGESKSLGGAGGEPRRGPLRQRGVLRRVRGGPMRIDPGRSGRLRRGRPPLRRGHSPRRALRSERGHVAGELATAPTVEGVSDVSFSAADSGSGVWEAVFSVDGQVRQTTQLDENGGHCRDVGQDNDGLPAFLYVQPCASSLSADVGLDTTKLANGTHHWSSTWWMRRGTRRPCSTGRSGCTTRRRRVRVVPLRARRAVPRRGR